MTLVIFSKFRLVFRYLDSFFLVQFRIHSGRPAADYACYGRLDKKNKRSNRDIKPRVNNDKNCWGENSEQKSRKNLKKEDHADSQQRQHCVRG